MPIMIETQKNPTKIEAKKRIKKISMVFVFIAVLFSVIILSIRLGSVKLTSLEVIRALFINEESIERAIVFGMRVPRALIAVFVGANLAVAGALLQAVMKNPLADPGLTGVSAGGSLAAITILLLFPQFSYLVPIGAFVGGAAACFAVYTLAWKKGIQPLRIILAGVAVNSILGGFTSLLSILNSDKIQGVLLWVNGSVAHKAWHDVRILIPYSVVGLTAAFFCTRNANLLQLGDSKATNLGTNVNRTRLILSMVAVFLAGISVSMVGIIGFVGLIVPHICRMLIGSDYKYLLPSCMIVGATVLIGADTIARTIAAPVELPVGIIMAVLGGPFFLYLLRKGRD